MKLFSYFYFLLLKLRYTFHIKWLENIDPTKHTIVFPNHQALVDPQIVMSLLSQKLPLSPVISQTYYNIPILKYFFQLLWSIPIGDLQRGTGKKEDITQAYHSLQQAVEKKKNILLYPAGQLYSQWFEVIKGKKTAHYLVWLLPKESEVILVRTTWLWWSIWSKAWDGKTPGVIKTFFHSFFIFFGNLFFLIPKREVFIEAKNVTKDIKSISDLNEFNTYLEDFYNQDGEEYVTYKKHFFYLNDTKTKKAPEVIAGSLKDTSQIRKIDNWEIPHDIQITIISKIAEIKDIPNNDITLSHLLVNDLYFDSLDSAEIKSWIQATFPKASNPPISDLKSVWDLCIMAIGKSQHQESLKPCNWTNTWEKRKLFEIIDKNKQALGTHTSIPALFKKIFKKNKNSPFVYDQIFWLQTRKDFLIKAYLVSGIIKKIDQKYIGVMLPSIGSASLIIMAIYLAGKTPVMLNWTLWEAALLHSVKFTKISTILTSKNFYEKVQNEGTQKLKEKYVFLEQLLGNISLMKKIKAVIEAQIFSIPNITYSSEAVLLFTSWSESLPKAVSLTHQNLIEDIIWALYHFPITNHDRLIWFLPPFHSFWFTINTILPLISGLKVAYTPDPNDARNIANMITHCHITTLTATPTFLKMILKSSSPEDLTSLKYAVVGAEKCPVDLAENFSKFCPSGTILEWYGITECSPVISINPPQKPKLGSVWVPIKWGDIKIISLDGKHILENTQEWMIYFAWENVFSWYIDPDIESPFEEIDGKKYYKTGDLWYLDPDNYLYITGRLKRFIKIAGEMISLPFIESILLQKYGSDTENTLAVEAKETNGEVKIVVFSTLDITKEEVWEYLRNSGVSTLVKINEVLKIDAIPVLGTGKTDYKVLKEMI